MLLRRFMADVINPKPCQDFPRWRFGLMSPTVVQAHRHTSTSIYHAFRGSGTSVINGEKFHWQKGDTFIVPLWVWHEHANASTSEEAILFSMHDEPILKAFGLYREEGANDFTRSLGRIKPRDFIASSSFK